MFLYLAWIAVVVIIVAVASMFIVVIPGFKMSVVEDVWSGRKKRILQPGIHLIGWPFERLRYMEWCTPDNKQVFKGYCMPMRGNYEGSADGEIVHFRVADPEAACAVEDPLLYGADHGIERVVTLTTNKI